MTDIIWVAIIKGSFLLCSTLIPSVVIFYLGKRYVDRAKLVNDFIILLEDMRTMISIEELHIREHTESIGESKKNTIRNFASIERGHSLSGKFSKSKIEKKLISMNKLSKEITHSMPKKS